MNFRHLFFVFFLGVLTACGGTSDEDQLNLLVGHWDLIEGKRNGKPTESLRDTYFEFTADGKMSTNLPIKGGMDSTYEIKEQTIVQTIINDIKINYAIEELTPTSLKLTTQLRGYSFNFSLEKAMESEVSMAQ